MHAQFSQHDPDQARDCPNPFSFFLACFPLALPQNSAATAFPTVEVFCIKAIQYSTEGQLALLLFEVQELALSGCLAASGSPLSQQPASILVGSLGVSFSSLSMYATQVQCHGVILSFRSLFFCKSHFLANLLTKIMAFNVGAFYGEEWKTGELWKNRCVIFQWLLVVLQMYVQCLFLGSAVEL
ncbi:hypothetical protein BDQ17DRAFT_1544388 [Cyathus striatus]|nr:hypothetical protein BDQ17DRAFT_1544388 [Cyathus striatus]